MEVNHVTLRSAVPFRRSLRGRYARRRIRSPAAGAARGTALRAACALGIGLAIYLLIVAVVGMSAPQRMLKMGEDRCFDEMCFAPTRMQVVPAIGPPGHQVKADGNFCVVNVRASSHARGRAQREAGVNASLIDSAGHIYQVSPQGETAYEATFGSTPRLSSRLQSGESVTSVSGVSMFPSGAPGLSLHFGHSGAGLVHHWRTMGVSSTSRQSLR